MCGSLDSNALCGLYKIDDVHEDDYGDIKGTYNAEGLIKICESLKSSSLTSLR